MTLPQAEAAIEDLRHAHRELLGVVDSLSAADWERFVPYGDWTVKDLIAHAIGDMSPSGAGLIHAGVLTPEFIAATSKGFDVRARNASIVEERRRYTREDLRQLLFESHDAMIEYALMLDESNLPVLNYPVPMGPDYEIKVEDWLWQGYHDREHTDDIRRALETDWRPEQIKFIPEIEDKMRLNVRAQEGFLRAAYSVAEDAWEAESAGCPGWTYHDIVAHVASNEKRREARLRSAIGDGSQAELAAINDVDAWNKQAVEARRGVPFRALIDELQSGWHGIQVALSRFGPDDLSLPVTLGGGETIPASEFLDRMAGHTSRHGGQLVPASRRLRFAMKSQR
ncbi:MAG TPA: maleylpyruvate isomerase N-terminal domain-containing protein [Dehalococcoidia bacterium]|nr:maleylpyruvate isomerase N-terminal domain-containing protein [Dehalococcoidia bacterium]